MSIPIKHLYNEYEAENIDGLDLSNKVEKLLEPLFREIQSNNFSMRDALSIVTSAANCIVAEKVLRKAIAKRTEERLLTNKMSRSKLEDRFPVPVPVFYDLNNL